jgi:hypothetical protein
MFQNTMKRADQWNLLNPGTRELAPHLQDLVHAQSAFTKNKSS